MVILDQEKKCDPYNPNQSYFHLMKVNLIATVSNSKMIFCNETLKKETTEYMSLFLMTSLHGNKDTIIFM